MNEKCKANNGLENKAYIIPISIAEISLKRSRDITDMKRMFSCGACNALTVYFKAEGSRNCLGVGFEITSLSKRQSNLLKQFILEHLVNVEL